MATDHVIESFRNTLWPGYKTGEGMDLLLYAQFQPLEDALSALGVVVWPMVEFVTGSWNDPIKKTPVKARMTTRWTSPTTEVFEMYAPGKDGKEMKMMEITYTKK